MISLVPFGGIWTIVPISIIVVQLRKTVQVSISNLRDALFARFLLRVGPTKTSFGWTW